MSHAINHRVGILATPAKVYSHLTETPKLALWWTRNTQGSGAKVGDSLQFWFNDFCQGFTVTELERAKRVVWKSPKGQGVDEWEETEVSFELQREKKLTYVNFRHSGWKEPTEFHAHCSMKWAVFLLSLKQALEKGRGRPFPRDIAIE